MAGTVGDLVRSLKTRLRKEGSDAADFEARLLVGETLGLTLTDLVVHSDRPVEAREAERVEQRLARRLAGEPVHRILGRRAFYGLELALSPDTLEPRPDTETLVDAVRPHVEKRIAGSGTCSILDLGTGTGAIALALLSLYPEAHATGTDIADGALATAAANARAHGLGNRFRTCRSDWFAEVDGRFDILVSNPPYIATEVVESLDRAVRDFDPVAALDGGADGLDAYRVLSRGARDHLTPGGIVAVETGYDQREAVALLFAEAGLRLVSAVRDLGGRDRVMVFEDGQASPKGTV